MHTIEFVGMPRAGKTTQIGPLERYLKSLGYGVAVIDDRVRASRLRVPATEALMYEVSFAIAGLHEYYRHAEADFLIIDRGFNDVRAWADCYCDLRQTTPQERDAAITLFDRFACRVSLTLNFQVPVDEVLRRHSRLGHSIDADEVVLNPTTMHALHNSYQRNSQYFYNATTIDGRQPIPDIQQTIKTLLSDLL